MFKFYLVEKIALGILHFKGLPNKMGKLKFLTCSPMRYKFHLDVWDIFAR
jgi:hypothetical protein